MGSPAFTLNRAEVIDRNFVSACRATARDNARLPAPPPDQPLSPETLGPWLAPHGAGPHGAPADCTPRLLLELFESQLVSRHLDLMARALRKEERGYYTIGSSGHEGNAVLGRVTRFSDPGFLHYRSGALMVERARQVSGEDVIRHTLLGMMASAEDPVAGGRHKVWGSVRLAVPPQTSTIASHLPRAVGAALALERAKRLGLAPTLGDHGPLQRDSIILCTFGDASCNHSVAAGAFNAACYAAFQHLPVPVLFVCEDNEIGISVHTPAQWIEASFRSRPGLSYFRGDGLNLLSALAAAQQAVTHVRARRRPAFLHLKLVRLLGHAGSDPETEYHTLEQIEQAEARDPLLAGLRLLTGLGIARGDELLSLYESVRERVARCARRLDGTPQLRTAAEVVRPLAPLHLPRVEAEAARFAESQARATAWGGAEKLPERQPPRHMAVNINRALFDLLVKYPQMLVFGEDVAQKGGVYHVTAGLSAKFGLARVFNTLLDETTILGMAIGAGHLGLLPVPEIQYLAYVHNAIDQLRGEACSTQFFSRGQFRNPMVVRINSLGYQKGFGGHFHNDNSIAALRDIPGLIVCAPARGDDAARMLRTCLALAAVDGSVVAFLEPIALYMTRDLYENGDGLWQFAYPPPGEFIRFGEGRVYAADEPQAREPRAASAAPRREDLCILTYANGVHISLRAARVLEREHNVVARVVDLRWLSPLNERFIVEQARAAACVLVLDEGRRSGGVAEAIVAALVEHGCGGLPIERLTGHDTYVPLGPAANLVLPTERDVVSAALGLTRERPSASITLS
jgi:2-oxoisovalerate dehydrogenase E1 component